MLAYLGQERLEIGPLFVDVVEDNVVQFATRNARFGMCNRFVVDLLHKGVVRLLLLCALRISLDAVNIAFSTSTSIRQSSQMRQKRNFLSLSLSVTNCIYVSSFAVVSLFLT